MPTSTLQGLLTRMRSSPVLALDMALTDFVDPYLDPTTGILRNKVSAWTQVDLDKAEADLVLARAVKFTENLPSGDGGLQELCSIHFWLFQDIYDWSGEIRTVDIRKSIEGAGFFLPVSMILRASNYAADELKEDNSLRGMNRTDFMRRLAYHYDQFNYIHPFREGNGRTQRIFWTRIARDAGWGLNWSVIQGPINDHACRVAAENRDFAPLERMFDEIVFKLPVNSKRQQ